MKGTPPVTRRSLLQGVLAAPLAAGVVAAAAGVDQMLIGEIISVALGALRANKLRSLLTMLGIVIGVAAVIAVVALGAGAQAAVNARISSLGTTLLTVMPGQQRGGGGLHANRAGNDRPQDAYVEDPAADEDDRADEYHGERAELDGARVRARVGDRLHT